MQQKSSNSQKHRRRCTYCGANAPIVWVHGHGQCRNCGINVEECCRGEQCQMSQKDGSSN